MSCDGTAGHGGRSVGVRAALAAAAVDAQQPDEAPIHVMTLHKSKSKEFDAVVIVEGRHDMPLLDTAPGSKAQEADRRLLRVAITQARHLVVIIRPAAAPPLTPTALLPRPPSLLRVEPRRTYRGRIAPRPPRSPTLGSCPWLRAAQETSH
ncbi:3'-5' exonuclease [Kribbella sp. NPDC020789]